MANFLTFWKERSYSRTLFLYFTESGFIQRGLKTNQHVEVRFFVVEIVNNEL